MLYIHLDKGKKYQLLAHKQEATHYQSVITKLKWSPDIIFCDHYYFPK